MKKVKIMTNIWQKRWFQPAPKIFLTCVFYLSLCSLVCVCVCSTTKKKRSQAEFAFDAVDAASHISGNYGTISLKLWGNKYFPLFRHLPFQRALFILYSILRWSIILCFCSWPARLWHRGVLWEWCPAKKPARQVKDLKANHEICRSVGDIVALGARASWRTSSCGSLIPEQKHRG